jgi:hypothetical protein
MSEKFPATVNLSYNLCPNVYAVTLRVTEHYLHVACKKVEVASVLKELRAKP